MAAKRLLSKMCIKANCSQDLGDQSAWVTDEMDGSASVELSAERGKKGFSGYTNGRSIHSEGPVAV